MAGASAAFFIGRNLGRDFAASLIGNKLKKYDDGIERNGFATVLYLRLVYFPFTPMNFGMGLTKVRFWDYFAGTGLGIIVGTFIFTFFIGTLKDVWASGNWGELISFKVFFSIGLFIFSFFIPTYPYLFSVFTENFIIGTYLRKLSISHSLSYIIIINIPKFSFP